MKQFYAMLFVTMTAITAHATDYNVPITVTVNGVSSEQKSVLSVVENDGLYDITLKNFMLQSEDGPMGVGNVELKDIESYKDGDATLFYTNRQVAITNGDDPSVSYWMASMLPPVSVNMNGKIEGGHLRCYLEIDLMEALQQTIQVEIGDGYQLPNPGFESWHASTETTEEPNGWHSFESGTGDLIVLAGNHLAKSKDAFSGQACARIFSTSIFGIVANGTMTTGRMNAGAFAATDPANHAFLDMSKEELDGNGAPFYVPLYSCPDSIALWVKFNQGTPNAEHPYASISAVITDGTYYQDPEDKEYTNVVAKAQYGKITTTGSDWVRLSVPFAYTKNAVNPQAVLVTISTNADPGQGSDGDEVLIDDIRFIYNGKVSSMKIKGKDVPAFNSENLNYEMELNEEITADDIKVAVDGKATNIIKTVEVDGDSYICSVVAIGGDMKAATIYEVKVKSSATAIRDLHAVTNQAATYFTLDGRQVETLLPGRIYICRQADGTVTKIRR
ncbi:MAG: PCMD domain-containing protein [Prevotella sp.]|nr:PCMD domain-containing protein [Prevotella sp.]